jgi:hypothetical protein
MEWVKFYSKGTKDNIVYDALTSGWDVFQKDCIIYGRWLEIEQHLHINIFKLKVILFTLLTFNDLKNQLIMIQMDSMTCVVYINHQGGTTSTMLSKIAKEL